MKNRPNKDMPIRHSALDMPTDEFRALGHSLIEQIADFYDSIPDRNLAGTNTPEQVRDLLGTNELPAHGMYTEELLATVGATASRQFPA